MDQVHGSERFTHKMSWTGFSISDGWVYFSSLNNSDDNNNTTTTTTTAYNITRSVYRRML